MPKYYLTVGLKYKYEEHPFNLHPDYFYLFEAENIDDAREFINKCIGSKWAFIYGLNEIHKQFFKGGELPFPFDRN